MGLGGRFARPVGGDGRVLGSVVLTAVIGLAGASGLTGCGGSSKAATSPTTVSATTVSVTTSPVTTAVPAGSPSPGAAAPAGRVAAITKDWTAFFDAKTPVASRVDLLQDGQQFASIIRSQAGSGLASSATAKVTAVAVRSATQAQVKYTILVAGTPALSGQSGMAVLQDGTWKVGDSSFCGLLILENGGKTAGLPAACPSP